MNDLMKRLRMKGRDINKLKQKDNINEVNEKINNIKMIVDVVRNYNLDLHDNIMITKYDSKYNKILMNLFNTNTIKRNLIVFKRNEKQPIEKSTIYSIELSIDNKELIVGINDIQFNINNTDVFIIHPELKRVSFLKNEKMYTVEFDENTNFNKIIYFMISQDK